MKLKSNLVLGALALSAALTGCSSDEPAGSVNNDSTDAITLKAYVPRSVNSRAAIETANTLQSNGFGVFAYYNEGKSTSETAISGAPNFMSKQKVTYSDNAWTYTPVKYWSKNTDAYYHFLAYAPFSAGDNINVDGLPVLSYEAKATEATSNYDFMTALQTDYQKSKTGATVPFTFNHRTTRLGFMAATSDTYTGATIKITSAKLTGINTKGSYDLLTNSWSSTSASEYAVVSSASSALLTTSLNLLGEDQYLFLVPTSGASYKLELEYTIEQAGPNNTTITYNEKAELTPAKDTTKDFLMGKAYNFNITIGLDAIQFTLTTVTDWENGDDVEKTL
jgi:outer membrane murein-binding lipoprotein Lpp